MKTTSPINSYLFVYGTLRNGISIPVKEAISGDLEWLSTSAIRGKMYDLGEYPGARPVSGEDSNIEGDVYRIKKPKKVLNLLDEYEGYNPKKPKESEYLRSKETIVLKNGQKVKGWVYWYNFPVIGKLRIPDSNYLDYLKKKSA